MGQSTKWGASALCALLLASACGGDGKGASGPAKGATESACGDGIDNDRDGRTDCADLDCRIAGGSCALAPPLDRSVASTLGESAVFLYSGPDPLQREADPKAFDARRIALLRGRVVDRTGDPLAGVRVSIASHPEYGYTLTRPDGLFDLAVNGSSRLLVDYEKDGLITVQRAAQPGWQRYGRVPEVGMVAQSTRTSEVPSESGEAQSVAGDAVEDDFGKHQAFLVFQPGTKATAKLDDGSEKELPSIHVHVTEYPLERTSPKNWTRSARFAPGTLPSSSGVHYGLDITTDEAAALGAKHVTFSKPVSLYVENVLGLPVGTAVPTGYYDTSTGQWQPSPGGVVVKILDVSGGTAKVDADGDGTADTTTKLDALGITTAERATLSSHYKAGSVIWRTAVTHFSSWDAFFPVASPRTATAPSTATVDVRSLEVPSRRGNEVVETQAVGQSIGIAGTPYSLHYQSDRTMAYGPGLQLEVPLIGGAIPPGLEGVLSTVEIAGQQFQQYFDPSANLNHVVTWDGNDGFGRPLQGPQTATVSITFFYEGAFAIGESFGAPGAADVAGVDTSIDVPNGTLTATFEMPVGVWDAKGYGLGGLSLDVLHAYDPAHQTIFFGWGDLRAARNVALAVTEPAKAFDVGTPDNVAVAPDGSAYVTDDQQFDETAPGRIFRVGADGTTEVIAGPGAKGDAAKIVMGSPQGLVIKADGTVVVADYLGNAIRAIHGDGSMTTLVSENTDDHPDVLANLEALDGLALGQREELYIVNGSQVFRLEGGVLTPFAGVSSETSGNSGDQSDDGGAALSAVLVTPSAVAVGPDGSVYISEAGKEAVAGGHRVRRVLPDGTIRTVAGTGTEGFSGDGHQAATAALSKPHGLAVAPDGTLYIADQGNQRIRRVSPDGLIQTIFGGGISKPQDAALAENVKIDSPDGLALGKDGALYVAAQRALYRLAPGLPAISAGDSLIPSTDGRSLYRFDARGRHEATIDAMTGITLLTFAYDDAGRIASVADENGQTTTIERGGDGAPAAIVAPFGQRTTLALGPSGNLETVTDPLNRSVTLEYDAGRLVHVTNPKKGVHSFGYDPVGRLISVTDPTGYKETLARTDTPTGHFVTVTTPGKRATQYAQDSAGDTLTRSVKLPDQSRLEWSDARISRSETAADGTQTTTYFDRDPAFGAQSLVPTEVDVATPSGRTLSVYPQRTKQLTDIDNPLSLEVWNDLVQINDRTYESVYTRSNRTLKTTSPEGRSSTTTFDTKGRPEDVTAPGLATVHYDYDDAGHVMQITRKAGREVRMEGFTYARDGLLATATDSMKHVTSFVRDDGGRVTQVTLPDKNTVLLTLDPNDNVTSVTPPGRKAHGFTYNDGNLLTAATPPLVPGASSPALTIGASRYDYDADFALTQLEHSDGRSIGFGYDLSGRLEGVELAKAKLSYSYDAGGTLTSVNRSDSVRTDVGHDGPRWTFTKWTGAIKGSVKADYDENFWLSSLTVNDASTVSFSYDKDGLVTGASASGGAMTLTRAPDTGFVTSTSLGDVDTATSINPFGELTNLSATFTGSAGFSQAIDRDALGRISHINEVVGADTHELRFTYDDVGRLTESERDGTITAYEYDANGNRTRLTVDGVETATGTYDAQDRIQSYGTATYEQTAQGDLLRKTDGASTLELAYDELGNLMNAIVSNGNKTSTIEYVVDGFGRRIAERVNGSFSRAWLYRDALRPISEVDADGTFMHFVYTNSDSAPDFILRSGKPYRVVKDHLGSVRLVVNAATGEVAQQIDYDEFGQVLKDTNPGFQPFGFAGGLYDAQTGLVRFGARDYDASVGRWIAKDPTGFEGEDANLYVYCQDDPINHIDPTGLVPKWLLELDDAGILKSAGDFFAGLASNLTLGASDWIISAYGLDRYGSKDSIAYGLGQIGGFAFDAYGIASGLTRLATAGGRVLVRKASGGALVRVFALRGQAARPSVEFLKIKDILRVEAHPIRRSWSARRMWPHFHIDAIDALSGWHLPIVEPIIGGYILWKFK